jgi:MFS family permease
MALTCSRRGLLGESLHANLSDLEWTVNAYNLAFAVALQTGAAMGDRYGRKRMFVIGVLGFTVASASSTLSPGVGALIAACSSAWGFYVNTSLKRLIATGEGPAQPPWA